MDPVRSKQERGKGRRSGRVQCYSTKVISAIEG